MKREMIGRIYNMCKKEEKERCLRARKSLKGTEIFNYILIGIAVVSIMFNGHFSFSLILWCCGVVYSLTTFDLYFMPLLYEKEAGGSTPLLEKYRYTPVDLGQLCVAKAIIFCSKLGKLYLINLAAAALNLLIYSELRLFIYSSAIIGVVLLGLCICFCFNLRWQYRRG